MRFGISLLWRPSAREGLAQHISSARLVPDAHGIVIARRLCDEAIHATFGHRAYPDGYSDPSPGMDRFNHQNGFAMTLCDRTMSVPNPTRLIILAALSLLPFRSDAQGDTLRTDTTINIQEGWRSRHSPTKATIFSAVLPGAGQVYNRKYWKVPIVLGGLGVAYYFVDRNTSEYTRYKDAYIAITDNDPNTVDEFNGRYSAGAVLDVANTYRKWRDLSWICTGAVYVLNIMDAAVDAHFVRFDVGEDLSMAITPAFGLAAQGAVGIGLSFQL